MHLGGGEEGGFWGTGMEMGRLGGVGLLDGVMMGVVRFFRIGSGNEVRM